MENKTCKMAALGASAFIMIMANTMLFPVFPQMRRALDVGLQEISLLVLAVSLPSAFLNPVAGYLSDIWGRKKIMIPSIILYGLGGAMAGFSVFIWDNPFPPLLFFRFLQGVGSATPIYLAVTLAGDIFQSQERSKAMGFIETANGLGKVFSPVLGGTLGILSWYAPFFLYPVVSLPVALALWLFIEEPPVKEKASLREELKTCQKMLSYSIGLSLLTGLITIFAVYGTMFWLGEMLEDRLPDGTFFQGLIIALPVTALIITALFNYRLTNLLGPRLLLITGLSFTGISILIVPFFSDTFFLWPAILLLGASAGLLLPTIDTISTAVAARGHRGIITTTFGGFRCLGAAIAPYFIATFLQVSLFATFLPLVAASLILAGAIYFLAREEEMLPQELSGKSNEEARN